MAPMVGFEPTTFSLTASRATVAPHRNDYLPLEDRNDYVPLEDRNELEQNYFALFWQNNQDVRN